LEALFGLLLCMVVTPLGLLYSLIMLCKAPGHMRRWLPLLVYVLGVMAYSLNPFTEIDLIRYFYRAQEYGTLPLSRIFYDASGLNQYDVMQWVYVIWSWVVGQIGALHLLPMVTIMTVYGIAFYITADLAHRLQGEKYITFIVIAQLCMIPFLSVAANIRNVWAFSMIIMAVYLDLIKKEKNLIVLMLYILPGFIHGSAFLLLLLRFLCQFGSKVFVPLFAGAIAFPKIIDFLYGVGGIFSSFGAVGLFINLSIIKLYWYLHDTGQSEWAEEVSNSLTQQVNRLVMVSFAVIACLLILFWVMKHLEKQYRPFLNFYLLLNICIIAFTWFTVPHFWRLSAASFVCVSIFLLPILQKRKESGSLLMKLFPYILLCYMMMGTLLQIWMTHYVVHPSEWLVDALTTNIFTIIFDIFEGIL
jgi:hypothetical protein